MEATPHKITAVLLLTFYLRNHPYKTKKNVRHCWRSKDDFDELLHMKILVLADQQRLTFISFLLTLAAVIASYKVRSTIMCMLVFAYIYMCLSIEII